MASWVTDPPPTNDPTYSGGRETDRPNFGVREANLSLGKALSDAGGLLEGGVTAIDASIKRDIKDSVNEIRSDLNKRTGVDEAANLASQGVNPTGVAGATSSSIFDSEGNPIAGVNVPIGAGAKTGKGVPEGITRFANQAKGINQAYNNGELGEAYVQAWVESRVAQLISKYKGYETEIRDAAKHGLGMDANTLRKTIQADMDATAKALQANQSKEVSFLQHNMKFLDEGDIYAYRTGKKSFYELENKVLKNAGDEHKLSQINAGLNTTEAINKNIASKATADIQAIVTDIAASKMAGSIENLPGTIQENLINFDKMDGATKEVFLKGMQKWEMDTRAEIHRRLQENRDAAGYNIPYKLSRIGKDVNEIVDNAMKPHLTWKQFLFEGNSGLANAQQRQIKYTQDQALNDLYKRWGTAATYEAINKHLGKEVLNIVLQDQSALTDANRGLRDAVFVRTFDPNIPEGEQKPVMMSINEAARQKGLNGNDKGALAYEVSKQHVSVLTNPKSTPQQVAAAAHALYQEGNWRFLDGWSSSDQAKVFSTLVNEQVSKKIFESGSAQTKLNYANWAESSIRALVQRQATDLREAMGTTNYQLAYDGKSMRLTALVNLSDPPSQFVRYGPNGEKTIDRAAIARYEAYKINDDLGINNINGAINIMRGVWDRQNLKPEEQNRRVASIIQFVGSDLNKHDPQGKGPWITHIEKALTDAWRKWNTKTDMFGQPIPEPRNTE